MQKYVIKDEADLATIEQAVKEIAATRKKRERGEAAAPSAGNATTQARTSPGAVGAKATVAANTTSNSLPLIAALGAVLLVMLAIIGFSIAGNLRGGKVPDVVGQKIDIARSALMKAGYTVKIAYDDLSGKPAGTVISMAPTAGSKAKPHAAVTVTVAGKEVSFITPGPGDNGNHPPPPPPPVNNGSVSGGPPPIPPTTTTATTNTTTPVNTAIKPPTTTLVVASASVKVPDLKGLKAAEGQAKLTEAGFHPVIEKATDAAQPNGVVLASVPVAGTSVERGAKVTLKINDAVEPPKMGTPREPPMVTLKDYVGAPGRAIPDEFERMGLTPKFVHEPNSQYSPGTVFATVPPAGSRVPLGGEVVVKLAL